MWWASLSDPFGLRAGPDGHHIHASCIAVGPRALLIAGPSGSGKSSLALELMALGAGLVADDVTELYEADGALMARAPATLPEAIEARGLGLLPAQLTGPCAVVAALDLGRRAAERLPQSRTILLLDQAIPLLHRPASGPVSAMLLQYLRHGR
ncbi:MAG: serine kinase [Pseudomonadota bacterium]